MALGESPHKVVNRERNALRAYLLGLSRFEDVLALQRRLAYEVGGGDWPTLVLCEHEPIVTVGRHGSYAHLPFGDGELRARRLPLRWVNRSAGFWLQSPGQLAIYVILPLRNLCLTVPQLRESLHAVVADLLAEYELRPDRLPHRSSEIWVNGRPLASLGFAIRHWVTYYGMILNVSTDLEPFRYVRTGKNHPSMTSLERECRRPLRIAHIRQRFLEHFGGRLGFSGTSLFTEHVQFARKASADAIAAAR